MKVVYVAGRYRAPTTWERDCNIHAARRAGADVAKCGAYPIIPHSNTSHMDGLCADQFWLDGTLELMRRADAVLMVPGWRTSVGATGERAEAERLGLPVFERVEDLAAWLASESERAKLENERESRVVAALRGWGESELGVRRGEFSALAALVAEDLVTTFRSRRDAQRESVARQVALANTDPGQGFRKLRPSSSAIDRSGARVAIVLAGCIYDPTSWCYCDADDPERGTTGPFSTRQEAVQHAGAAGYSVPEVEPEKSA